MPRNYEMTWRAESRRWQKIVDGKVYVVSCRQLRKLGYLEHGVDDKQGSYAAANRWLEDQLQIIPPHPMQVALDVLQARKDWARDHGQPTEVFDRQMAALRNPWVDIMAAQNAEVSLNHNREVWEDRLQGRPKKTADINRTISHHQDRFLTERRAEVDAGILSPEAYRQTEFCLRTWREWMPDSIDEIGQDKWKEWWNHLLSRRKPDGTAYSYDQNKKMLSYPRMFIKTLIGDGLVKPFEALHSKRYTFRAVRSEPVKSLTVDEVKEVLDTAKGIMRLHIMLMLNCGFLQRDIATLKISQYKDGRIVRRRSKTDHKGTREVTWTLWPETVALLEQYKQTSGEHLLLTSNGTVWADSKKDAIASIYNKLDTGIALKRFRQTSGNAIFKQFGKHVYDHFMGHGQGVVDRGYLEREQAELDKAVAWLRLHYEF